MSFLFIVFRISLLRQSRTLTDSGNLWSPRQATLETSAGKTSVISAIFSFIRNLHTQVFHRKFIFSTSQSMFVSTRLTFTDVLKISLEMSSCLGLWKSDHILWDRRLSQPQQGPNMTWMHSHLTLTTSTQFWCESHHYLEMMDIECLPG